MQPITPGPRYEKKKKKKKTWLARKQEGKGREGPLSLKTKPHFERNGENVCGLR